ITNAAGRMPGSPQAANLQPTHPNRPTVVRRYEMLLGRLPMEQPQVIGYEIHRNGPSLHDLLDAFSVVRVAVRQTDGDQTQPSGLQNLYDHLGVLRRVHKHRFTAIVDAIALDGIAADFPLHDFNP